MATIDPRYSRSVLLPGMGLSGQQRLQDARVLVIGAGGLGAPVIQYLATSGVGTLGLVDDDVVELSNLQRQVIFRADQVGMPKARAAADWVRAVNPALTVAVHALRLDEGSLGILDSYDLIVDGSDSFDTCYLVADAAAARGLPIVWGSVSRFDGQVSVFWDAAPDDRGVDYRDLHPAAPAGGWDESCADVGVLGPLCGTVGSVMASEAIKLLTGIGEPLLGRVVTIDAASGSWRESRLRRSPERAAARAAVAGATVSVTEPRSGPKDAPASATGYPSVTPAVLTPDELRAELSAHSPADLGFTLLDVREESEFSAGTIPGAVAATGFGSTSAEHPALPEGSRVVVFCQRGPRADAAAGALLAEGFDVAVLRGGYAAWQRATVAA